MMNPEDLTSRRNQNTQENSNEVERQRANQHTQETRQDNNIPEILTNPIYTPAFLREQIGKLMQVEFLIGTNNMVDRIGFLEDVGASYILLRSFEGDSLIYADIYAIKFITISATYTGMPSFQTFNNNMNMQNMNMGMNQNMGKYY